MKIIEQLLVGLENRSQHARLHQLDDRMLADIGLTRDELRRLNKRRR